jgi:hypothetical protein
MNFADLNHIPAVRSHPAANQPVKIRRFFFFVFGYGLFVGWVKHPDIFCWVSFLYPTYLPAIFVLSAKPNEMSYIVNVFFSASELPII